MTREAYCHSLECHIEAYLPHGGRYPESAYHHGLALPCRKHLHIPHSLPFGQKEGVWCNLLGEVERCGVVWALLGVFFRKEEIEICSFG